MIRRAALLLLACIGLAAQDGPYVQWDATHPGRAQVFTTDGTTVTERDRKVPFLLALPGLSAEPIRLSGKPYPPDGDTFPAPPKITAVSDIHGNFNGLLTLLKAHGVVDEKLHWIYGKGHLVIAGDVVDRGLQVTEALWFIHALEGEARRHGGRVHLLIGNHEQMLLSGDWRYTQALYTTPPPGMPTLAERFGPESEFGRWLRSKPAILKLGPFLFCHGGISPALAARGASLSATNQVLRAHLADRPREASGAAAFLLGPEGPLWYRGLLPDEKNEATDAEVNAILARYRVKALVVGHTTESEVESLHGGKVFAIDAGLKKGKGQLWIWEGGRAYRGLMDGRRVPLK